MLSKETISSAVQEILLTADLRTLSSKQVREKLEQRFNVSLMDQREEIDGILMDIIAKKFFGSEKARGLEEIDSSSALSPDGSSSGTSSSGEESESDNASCKASGSDGIGIPSDPGESDNLGTSDSGSANEEEDDEEIARRLQLEELGVRKRNVERRLSKAKRLARGEGAAPSSALPKKRRSAYTQECVLSPELAAVMGTDKLARKDVVSRMWKIFKERNLMDPKNKQFVLCDEQLEKVFKTKKFRAFGMMKILKHHIKDARLVQK